MRASILTWQDILCLPQREFELLSSFQSVKMRLRDIDILETFNFVSISPSKILFLKSREEKGCKCYTNLALKKSLYPINCFRKVLFLSNNF